MSEWQDISTAPKDGSRIMLWRGKAPLGDWAEMVIAEWHHGVWAWPAELFTTHGEWDDDALFDGYSDNRSFTHWMPLPPPPARANLNEVQG